MTSWLRDTGTVVVDLRGVVRFDRPGVAALIGVLRRVRGYGRPGGVAPSPCRRWCASCASEGLDRLFPIEPAPEELLGSAA